MTLPYILAVGAVFPSVYIRDLCLPVYGWDRLLRPARIACKGFLVVVNCAYIKIVFQVFWAFERGGAGEIYVSLHTYI
jgi:hypothetical protein